jgi:succinate dehydrogenase / fumarate reductase cytochrome b subunit
MRLVDALTGYRYPVAAIVSILHRISGMLLFFLLPFIVWLLDTSVSTEISFERFRSAFAAGIGFFPAWFINLVVLALIWAYLFHFMAGVRHLWMDVAHSVSKEQGRKSSWITIGLSSALTVLLGFKLFGLY